MISAAARPPLVRAGCHESDGVSPAAQLAVVVVEENLTQRGYDGTMRTQVLATNVFERADGRWWMISHHGSPVIAPPDSEEPRLQ